jgi:Protein of unknown function (DUF2721)
VLPDPSVSQLSQVITHAIAPAFLLGALAAFVSVLTLRMKRIVDRSQMLNAIDDADKPGRTSKQIFRLCGVAPFCSIMPRFSRR